MTFKHDSISLLFSYLLLFIVILNVSILQFVVNIPLSVFQILLYGTLLLVVVFFSKKFQINLRMSLVVIAAVISLILSNADARYDTTNRFLTWLLLVSTVGPLFYSQSLIRFRNQLFEAFVITFMLIGGLSFIYFLLDLPHLGRGHFTGVMNHSMIMAPVASIGALYAFYRFMKAPVRKMKLLFFILFLVNVFVVILAASRTAFVAMIAGLLVYLLINKFRFRRVIIMSLIIVTIVGSLTIDNFQQNAAGSDSLLTRELENTREGLWSDRIREFKAYPLFGVGFASQKDSLLKSRKAGESGNIEPGSTYLMVLSMTGLFGAFAMFVLLIKPLLSKGFWQKVVFDESYKAAIYVFFFTHFIAEGYLFASGSMMAFVFWLLLGATYPYAGINNTSRSLK